MKINDGFKTRIQLARQALNLTQGELANKVGVVRRQIAAYEAGDSKPRVNVLNNLAATLGTTIEWLALGAGESPDITKVRSTITLPLIPVITFAQAANISNDGDITGYDYIPAPRLASDSTFAIRIEGESMQSSSTISFPSGCTVIFDPESAVCSGDFVLCKFDSSGDVTFKQLIIDQGEYYLHPLNTRYMNIPMGKNVSIIGVAIESRNELSPDVLMLSKSGMMSDFMASGSYNSNETKGELSAEHLSSRLDKIESMLEKIQVMMSNNKEDASKAELLLAKSKKK